MKTIRFVNPFSLVLCLIFLFQNNSFAQKNYIDAADYEKSFAIWKKGKKEHKDSYEFSLTFGSFTGYTNKTTITVKNGKIVKRAFEERLGPGADKTRKAVEWVETRNQIGSHKDNNKLVTMTQIYAYAKNYVGKGDTEKEPVNENPDKIALPKLDISVFFSTDANGILSTAGYIHNGCMDDCFQGYHVRDFKWL